MIPTEIEMVLPCTTSLLGTGRRARIRRCTAGHRLRREPMSPPARLRRRPRTQRLEEKKKFRNVSLVQRHGWEITLRNAQKRPLTQDPEREAERRHVEPTLGWRRRFPRTTQRGFVRTGGKTPACTGGAAFTDCWWSWNFYFLSAVPLSVAPLWSSNLTRHINKYWTALCWCLQMTFC